MLFYQSYVHQTITARCCCRLRFILVSLEIFTVAVKNLLSINRNIVILKTGVGRTITWRPMEMTNGTNLWSSSVYKGTSLGPLNWLGLYMLICYAKLKQFVFYLCIYLYLSIFEYVRDKLEKTKISLIIPWERFCTDLHQLSSSFLKPLTGVFMQQT